MSNGYIYVLINESYKGLVKIGRTSINSNERARQLSSGTGVPTPFKVAYEIYSDNCEVLENNIHLELNDFRVNPNREFFNYPLNKSIELIQMLAAKENNIKQFEALEILQRLKGMYQGCLIPEVSSVRIYQTKDRVYLEVTEDEYIGDHLKDQVIRRTDLGFIADNDDCGNYYPSFSPDNPINTNVEKFISSGFTTILVCSNNLFTQDALDKNYVCE